MKMKINKELIKKLRLEKSWSQEMLADVAKVSTRTVQRVESEGKANFVSLKKIAEAFKVNVTDFQENDSVISDNESEDFYFRIHDGAKLAEVISNVYGCRMNHDSPKTEEESELLAGSLQAISDWGEVWSDLEQGDRVKASYDLNVLIDELGNHDFWVFGLKTNEEYQGFKDWPVANIFVMRSDNPRIIKLDATKEV